jgi:hypothetical protein
MRAFPASSLLPEVITDSTFRSIVLIVDRTDLLRRFLLTACFAFLMADLFFFGLALAGKSDLLLNHI